MFRSSIKIALVAVGIVAAVGMMAAAVIVTTQSLAYAEQKTGGEIEDECDGNLQDCYDSCDENWTPAAEANGQWHACYKTCQEQRDICSNIEIDEESSIGTTGSPPKATVGQPPVNVGGSKQPVGGSSSPPKGITGLPPVSVGGNKQPVGGGGTLPPKGPIGVHPISPVKPIGVVEQPPSGGGSGETIYARGGPKGGRVKPPVITTSPIEITTTTVYDKNGNSTSTNFDPMGKMLSKTTTIVDPTGGSRITTTNAEGKILGTTTNTPDKRNGGYISVIRNDKGEVSSSTAYDKTGKIVSQSAKIMTSTSGTGGSSSTGNKKVFMENGSQKHKEKAMNELFHEDKDKLNSQNWGSTSGASSPSAANHPQGRHR